MSNGSVPPSPSAAKNIEVLVPVGIAVAAIVAMPFVAGRHPSGAQTVLVLTACLALAAIALALLAYAGRRQQPAAFERRRDWPPPDELSVYRQRARR